MTTLTNDIKTTRLLLLTLTIAITTLFTSSQAAAEGGIGIFGSAGFAAEWEADQLSSRQGNVGLDDEDLDSNFGIGTWLDYEVVDNLFIGGRFNFMTGTGDDTEMSILTLDLGALARYVVEVGHVDLFASLAVGPTYFTGSADDVFTANGAPLDLSVNGFGFHVNVGAGVAVPVNDDLAVFGMFSYDIHRAGELGAELDGNNIQTIEGDLEDLEADRMLFSVGITYDLF